METRPTCAVGERWDVQEHRRVTLERRGKNMIGTGVGGMVVILLIYCCVPANKATSDYTKPIAIHAAGVHEGLAAGTPATAAAPARPQPAAQHHPQQPGGAAAVPAPAPHAGKPLLQPQVAQPYPQQPGGAAAQSPVPQGAAPAAGQSQQCGQLFMPDGSRVVYCGSHPIVHFGPDGRPIDYGFHPEHEGYPDPWR